MSELASNLPELPFTYVRTFDSAQAQYNQWRVSPISIDGQPNLPWTDERIVSRIREQKEVEQWYFSPYWREKGQPREQIEFKVNERPITVYNWSSESPYTDDHIEKTQEVLRQLGSRFPKTVDSLRWVLVDDIQLPSAFGDPIKYPTSGDASKAWNTFRLFPKGMEMTPNRFPPDPNFLCTFTHELMHLAEVDFEEDWKQKFQWRNCVYDEGNWEWRPTPDGLTKKAYNKQTGWMSPQGQFPMQPEACVTYYAEQNMGEDICESGVAYIYQPSLLIAKSLDKYNILKAHDAGLPQPIIRFHRVPSVEIRLPEIKPETVLYYIKEPSAA